MSELRLYNTLTREKERFEPIDPRNVRMYVCGPTVYDYAHIGNARPIIVFDVLYRLLRHLYGAEHVTYVRNITDVDDKINARAAEEGVPIAEITARTTEQFHRDIAALGVLEPTHEPRATEHIEEMKAMIERLVANGCAYVAEDHVLFDVTSRPDYGRLSRRSLEEMIAGARVEVAPFKRNPQDFVLWKPSKSSEPAWASPCGIGPKGRPGWHIECSAMSDKWLWQEVCDKLSEAGRACPHVFDIHGGGVDLVFPHHENEIAQSCCAHGSDQMARYWLHNGYLQVEGEKMSKSLGNFITIHELLEEWPGEVLRFNMLRTHYRQPLNWTAQGCRSATTEFMKFGRLLGKDGWEPRSNHLAPAFLEALLDDMNTPAAIAALHEVCDEFRSTSVADLEQERRLDALVNGLALLGFDDVAGFEARLIAFKKRRAGIDPEQVEILVSEREAARAKRDWAEADRIRDELRDMGIELEDTPEGTKWRLAR